MKYKNLVGIHIYSDWIGLVASLNEVLKKEEVQEIYEFYGNVANIKLFIEKDNDELRFMEKVNKAINDVGIKEGTKYLPNDKYKKILDHLKQIAKM